MCSRRDADCRLIDWPIGIRMRNGRWEYTIQDVRSGRGPAVANPNTKKLSSNRPTDGKCCDTHGTGVWPLLSTHW